MQVSYSVWYISYTERIWGTFSKTEKSLQLGYYSVSRVIKEMKISQNVLREVANFVFCVTMKAITKQVLINCQRSGHPGVLVVRDQTLQIRKNWITWIEASESSSVYGIWKLSTFQASKKQNQKLTAAKESHFYLLFFSWVHKWPGPEWWTSQTLWDLRWLPTETELHLCWKTLQWNLWGDRLTS